MLITKREEVTKQGCCKIILKKTPSSGKSLIKIYSLKWVGWGWTLIWVWLGGGGGGRLLEAGRLLTFSAFRMGAYSRWALIRGWALIRINTVQRKQHRTRRVMGSWPYKIILSLWKDTPVLFSRGVGVFTQAICESLTLIMFRYTMA